MGPNLSAWFFCYLILKTFWRHSQTSFFYFSVENPIKNFTPCPLRIVRTRVPFILNLFQFHSFRANATVPKNCCFLFCIRKACIVPISLVKTQREPYLPKNRPFLVSMKQALSVSFHNPNLFLFSQDPNLFWDLPKNEISRRSSQDLILRKIFAEFLRKFFWRFLEEKILWRFS